MSSGMRPLTRTVVVAVVGMLLGVAGYMFAIGGVLALGCAILMAIGLDGLRFGLYAARAAAPRLDRVVFPNPVPAGQPTTVTLRFPPGASRMGTDLVDLEETLPTALRSGMRVHIGTQTQPAALAYDLTASHRGQWTLGPCTIMRFSALRLWRATVADRSTSQLTAWPRTVELEMSGLTQDREGAVGMTGYQRPHQDNATVRVYNPGDDLRRIHWRSSARRDELMTRAEEPTATDRAWVGLVLPKATLTGRREVAISLVASWLVAMAESGYAVDLACGGDLHHGTASEHLTVLATLSNAEASLGLPASTPEGAALLVVARAATRSITQDMIARPPLGPGRRSDAVAVVLSDSQTDADLLEDAGWNVLRIPESMSLPDAGSMLAEFHESTRLIKVGA